VIRSVATALVLIGCASLAASGEPPIEPAGGESKPAASNAAAKDAPPAPTKEELADWTSRLKKIAGSYTNLSRVDDLSRWGPADCKAPTMPARVPMSAADPKASEHGSKLYALWAKDVESYGKISGLWLVEWSDEGRKKLKQVEGVDGLSQALVKESFEAVEMKPSENDEAVADSAAPSRSRAMQPALHDGKRWKMGAAKGLFVMMQFDKKPASSDDGWVYGTVAPDGAVTGVGRMDSCMACHTSAPHGRLFGLAKTEAK
jgi:hypothetical protein